MAKTIKFNLVCDGASVRTLEDLRNHFSMEDMLAYYENRLLHRWLAVRGYKEELEKVEQITTEDDLQRIIELINIFKVETDPKVIEANTYILSYKKERKLLAEQYEALNGAVLKVIDEYHQKYQQLVEGIIKNRENVAYIKAAVKEIADNYWGLFEMDYRNLFYKPELFIQ